MAYLFIYNTQIMKVDTVSYTKMLKIDTLPDGKSAYYESSFEKAERRTMIKGKFLNNFYFKGGLK